MSMEIELEMEFDHPSTVWKLCLVVALSQTRSLCLANGKQKINKTKKNKTKHWLNWQIDLIPKTAVLSSNLDESYAK